MKTKFYKKIGEQILTTLITFIVGLTISLFFMKFVLGIDIEIPILSSRKIITSPPYITRISQTKMIKANETGIGTFGITVLMKNYSHITLYPFHLQHVITKTYGARGLVTYNDVILYLPKEFIPKKIIQKDVNVEYKKRIRIHADPVFKKGEFSEKLPFSEIEIKVEKIEVYTDTNETFYEIYVRVEENSTLYDISSLEILTKKELISE